MSKRNEGFLHFFA